MTKHSVAEAKNRLSELIDRALQGESVVITRHGAEVVELRPVPTPRKAMTPEDMDWLAARRSGRRPAEIDSATLLSQIRDEEWR